MEWVLITVVLLGGPMDPSSKTRGIYHTMVECFRAREKFLSPLLVGDRFVIPNGVQAVCILTDNSENDQNNY